MKYFSLLLFSEQENSGVNHPAAAAQEISGEVNAAFDNCCDTGVISPAAEESRKKSKRDIYNEFIRANKEFFTEDTQKIVSLRLKEAKDNQEALEKANSRILDLESQLEKLKPVPKEPEPDFLEAYPDFILENELKNTDFEQLYNSGASVKSAFYAAHFDELVAAAVANARRDAVRATVSTVLAQGVRVKESASAQNSSLNHKRDISKLTKAQRADIARRVGSGEDIAFG